MWWGHVLNVLGVTNPSGRWYAWWSGAGSDLGELAIVGGLLALVRKHACHEPRCWRIGRHVVDGSPWCDRHHGKARSRQETP